MMREDGEMAGVSADTTWAFGPGEHACWLVRSPDEYVAGQQELISRAARCGEHVLIVGDAAGGLSANVPGVVVLRHDFDLGPNEVLEAMRRAVDASFRAGHMLRVLAQMERIVPPHARLEELFGREMDVADLAASGATSVVCAYRDEVWDRGVFGKVSAVHSRYLGTRSLMPSFRVTRTDTGSWALHGVIGFESVRAFAAVVRAALMRSPRLRLRCDELELIDASGLRALVEAAADTPGASVLLERVNATVLAAWQLSGYDSAGSMVQVQA